MTLLQYEKTAVTIKSYRYCRIHIASPSAFIFNRHYPYFRA
nr:MAG TPA: hypothetical protein [Caudoviricetes sp.]